jgi:hypothetical protein
VLKPSTILNGIVTKLRDIPELVVLVGGDASRIFAYTDKYPLEVNVSQKISRLEPGSVMVWMQSKAPANESGPWKHVVEFVMMPDDGGESEDMEDAIVNGIVTADEMRFEEVEPIDEVDPMQVIVIDRGQIDFTDSTFEYPRIVGSFTQKWPRP